MINEIQDFTKNNMNKCILFFKQNINKINTGQASVKLLDNIKIICYNNKKKIPLNQLANITVQDVLTLKIDLFDVSLLKEIEKEIKNFNLGISINIKGKTIFLSFPPLTKERRTQFTKLVYKESEKTKISIRNIRRESNEKIKRLSKEKTINISDSFKAQENIQKLTNHFIKKIEIICKEKELELNKI